jgi:hypothetical protein
VENLFRGTLNSAAVHPREVVKTVLKRNSASVILFDNRASSGVTEPSAADEQITRRIVSCLELIDVRVLDHFLGGMRCVTRARNIAGIVQLYAAKRIGTIQRTEGDSLGGEVFRKEGGVACSSDATPSFSPSRPCARRVRAVLRESASPSL